MKTICIIEDDISIHTILEEILKQANYDVLNAYSGTEALLLLNQHTPDLILLDLMLPGCDGEEIIKKANHIPIIVLSAKVSQNDKINCLLSGANDYITKPFDKNELLARIKVQLRINKEIKELSVQDLKLLNDGRTIQIKDKTISLTKTEYAIMKQLLINANQVLSKTQLLDLIRLDSEDCDENSLRVHISNLRKKLRTISSKEYIESIWGIGFKIKN